ncbi:MAG: hypothetical protein ABR962_07320 [Candidatus Bathyarchaeia archaeon]
METQTAILAESSSTPTTLVATIFYDINSRNSYSRTLLFASD